MANSNGIKPIKQPSIGALIAKAAFGVVFIVAGFTEASRGIGYILTALVMGLALIAWGVLGYMNGKKVWEEHQAEMKAQAQNRVRICKQCGARSTGQYCEYCGAPLE